VAKERQANQQIKSKAAQAIKGYQARIAELEARVTYCEHNHIERIEQEGLG
jgi:phage baseplate assembly protein W